MADSTEKLSKKARKALEVEARKKARLEAKEAAKQGKANKRKKGERAWQLQRRRETDVRIVFESRTNGCGHAVWRH